MSRRRETPIGFKITNAVDASANAGATVDPGGPLGRQQAILNTPYDTTQCPACHARNLPASAVCALCRAVLPPAEEAGDRQAAARQVARCALRQTGNWAAAKPLIRDVLHALGLQDDPQCQWQPRTMCNKPQDRRRARSAA